MSTNEQLSTKTPRRYGPDETQDYYDGDVDDEPEETPRRVYCTVHGFAECDGEHVDVRARQAFNARMFEYFYVS